MTKLIDTTDIIVVTAPAEMKAIGSADLLTTDAQFLKALNSVKGRGQAIQRDVHIIACSMLARLEKSNDVRVITTMLPKLFTILPQSMRTNALRDWLSAYAPIAWEGSKAVYTAKGITEGKVQLVSAMNDPFWNYSPEKAYVPVDVSKLIDSVIKKLTADQTKTDAHHGAVIEALEAAKAASKVDAAADAVPAE